MSKLEILRPALESARGEAITTVHATEQPLSASLDWIGLECQVGDIHRQLDNLTSLQDLHRVGTALEALPADLSQVSLEGLGSRVMEIIRSILAALNRFWQAVLAFVTGYENDTGQLKYQLEIVRTRISQQEGASPKRDSVTVGGTVFGMLTQRNLPDNVRPILLGLAELRRQMQVVRQHHVPLVDSVARSALPALAPPSSEGAEMAQWLSNLNRIAGQYNVHSVENALGTMHPLNDGSYPNGVARAGIVLPGLRHLVLIDGARLYPEKVNGNSRDQATVLQAHALQLKKLQSNRHDVQNLTIPTLSADHLRELSDGIENLLQEAADGAPAAEAIVGLSKQLGAAVERWSKAGEATVGDLQAGLRYATVFTTRLTHPYLQLLEHGNYVSQLALSFCRSHLAAYR